MKREECSVKIIAEAGVNHNGRLDIALEMVDIAADAGADYIKFQTFDPKKIASRYAEKAEYQKISTGNVENQLDMLTKLALAKEEYIKIQRYALRKGIGFISTPFDIDSVRFLDSLDMDFWKLASGEITNYPFLVEVARTKKDVILSTGMSTINEIADAVNVLKNNGVGKISLLHCNTQYPTPYTDVNLKAMTELRSKFNCEVGYSDHTIGIDVPVAAVALGATIIEKHFTLDKNMTGPDHKASLDPKELQMMVTAIRNIQLALGDGKKIVTASEEQNRAVARKSIVAARNINKGEILSEDNITTKRPGNGISPMRWNEVLGTKAIREFREDELIEI